MNLFCRGRLNPTKAIEKNHMKFAVDPILLLWMNQAKTIWKNSLKLQLTGPILPLWMNQAKTIWKNSLKLQMTPFCRCGKIQNDPILPP